MPLLDSRNVRVTVRGYRLFLYKKNQVKSSGELIIGVYTKVTQFDTIYYNAMILCYKWCGSRYCSHDDTIPHQCCSSWHRDQHYISLHRGSISIVMVSSFSRCACSLSLSYPALHAALTHCWSYHCVHHIGSCYCLSSVCISMAL